jgi:hypothetical protein
MLFLVDGTPGAGKSYFAVRKIADALAAGKVVVTNVPLSDDYAQRAARAHPIRRLFPGLVRRRAARYPPRVLITRSLEEVMRVRVAGEGEGRAVVVLDEAHVWLNSRMWGKDTTRAEVIEWVSGHRHLGLDIYLISQHIEDIDKQVRNRVEYRVRLRNLRRVKVAGIPIFPVNTFVAITELVSARNKPIVGRDWYFLKKRTAGMYDTHGLAAQDVPANAIWLPREPSGPPDSVLCVDGPLDAETAPLQATPSPEDLTTVAAAGGSRTG